MNLFEAEAAVFDDPKLPVIFHLDTVYRSNSLRLHWHENPELLFIVDGEAEVFSDSARETLKAGEIAVINCSNLHSARAVSPVAHYYCIIISRELCGEMNIPVGKTHFRLRISDPRARECIQKVIGELENKASLYRSAVKAGLCELLILFCREFTDIRSETESESKNKSTVKNALCYMQEHLAEALTVEEISEAAGFSKYYFCRVFREMTGSTVIGYLNLIRCRNARRLMLSQQYNVCESAEQSGYSNLSYFAKCYRRYIGELPSQTANRTNGHSTDSIFPL